MTIKVVLWLSHAFKGGGKEGERRLCENYRPVITIMCDEHTRRRMVREDRNLKEKRTTENVFRLKSDSKPETQGAHTILREEIKHTLHIH